MEQSRLNLIERLYHTLGDEKAWAPALQELSAFVGGHAVFHMASNPARNVITAADAVGVSAEMVREFEMHYAEKEIRIAPAIRYGVGVPLFDWQLVPLDEIRRSELYNAFLVPHDVPYLMGAWLKKTPTNCASFSFQRHLRAGPFTHLEADRFLSIAPHLLRVYEARQLLAQARATRFAYRELLDSLPFGIILLDRDGRMLDATTLAEQVLRENTLLGCLDGRVRAIHQSEHLLLEGAIDTICKSNGSTMSATVHLRSRGQRCLTVFVLPVPRYSLGVLETHARCMLLILDSRVKLRARVETVRQALELTHAEAALAVELFRSPTLRDAAPALGRSYNTCKTQLKSIYAKLHVNSHVELAHKIMLVMLANSPLEMR